MRARSRLSRLCALTFCRLGLLVLLLAIAAEPEDWQGSRYAEWNTIPNEGWWQYSCTAEDCNEFLQSSEKPMLIPVCHIHTTRAMKCTHNPEGG
jgi:hypothetical protein